jgi:predicted SAM-dependent methyltransferase
MNWTRRLFTALVGKPLTDALAGQRALLRTELRLLRIHRQGVAKAKALVEMSPHRLHLGCGNIYKSGWVNIDTYFCPPCTPDLTLDLRRPWPFPDVSCNEVYSEHLFEHVSFPDSAAWILRETLRVLIPGGRASIGVPDPRPVLTAYLEDTSLPYFDYFFNHSSVRRHLFTKMEAVNWLFKQGGEHQFIYDYPSLEKTLLQAGFTGVARRDFDPVRDSESRREGTIYVDAHRPA